jgi:hypothetical protein
MKLMELETPPPRVKEGKFEDSSLLGCDDLSLGE